MKKIFTFLIILLAFSSCKHKEKEYTVAISGVDILINEGEIIHENNEIKTETIYAENDDEVQDDAYAKYAFKLYIFASHINRNTFDTFVPIDYKIIDDEGNEIEKDLEKVGKAGLVHENLSKDLNLPEKYINFLGLDYYNLTPYGQRHPYEYVDD